MQVATIGLDIAKHALGQAQPDPGNVFQLHGVDGRGEVVLRKRLARSKVLEFFATTCRAAWLASRRAAWRGRPGPCG